MQAGRLLDDDREGCERREQQHQQEENIGKGHDQTLGMGDLHELLERHGLGIAAMTLQLLAKRIEGLERRLRGEGEPLMQPGKMEVGAVVEDGGKSGEPDRTAEIAGEIE
jgi:hypothetical protein